MVQADISQLTRECNHWRETLRSYREEFSHFRNDLVEAGRQSLSRNQLQDVEHYQNQFEIQLVNINHLKHSIKTHDRKAQFEMEDASGNISKETLDEHEVLFDQYNSLESTLQDLRQEFHQFLDKVHSTV